LIQPASVLDNCHSAMNSGSSAGNVAKPSWLALLARLKATIRGMVDVRDMGEPIDKSLKRGKDANRKVLSLKAGNLK